MALLEPQLPEPLTRIPVPCDARCATCFKSAEPPNAVACQLRLLPPAVRQLTIGSTLSMLLHTRLKSLLTEARSRVSRDTELAI